MGTNQQLSNTYRFSIVTKTFSEPLNSLTFSSVLDLLVLGHYFAFCVPHLPPASPPSMTFKDKIQFIWLLCRQNLKPALICSLLVL